MNTALEITHLIELLRTELEAYGTLFRLLEDQRAALLRQDAEEILDVSSKIDSHSELLNHLRKERESQVAGSTAWNVDEGRTLGNFIRQLKHESKPLLEELFGEINRLVKESKVQLERNQMLYRRAWDLGQELLRAFSPQEEFSQTYKRDGYSRNQGLIQRTGYVKMA